MESHYHRGNIAAPYRGSSGNCAGMVAGSAAHALITDPAGNVAVCADAGSVAHPDAAQEPAQEAPKTKPPSSGTPAGGAGNMARKQRERDQEAERARKVEEARASAARKRSRRTRATLPR